MKQIIVFIVLLLILAALILCGCGWNKSTVNTSGSDGRMMLVYNDSFTQIYVDTTTGTQYLSSDRDGMCVMVDIDGKPVPFSGFDAKEDNP